MSNWERVEEDGQEFWVNQDYGNVFKDTDGQFIAMFPKVFNLGPFKSVEQAQKVLETCKQRISQAMDLINEELVKEIEETK